MLDYSIMEQLTPDEVLLGLLAAQPAHGYQLLEAFRHPQQLGRVWHLSTSQLYAVLKRLERKGWIDGREVTLHEAPPRTEYTLTTSGRATLLAWLNEPHPSPSIRRVRVEFLSRLYIARLLQHPTAPIVRSQKRACLAQRELLLQEHATCAPGVGLLALEFVLFQLNALLDWIDRCELVPKEMDDATPE